MKKIQIQRVSVFDIVITLVLGVVFVLLPESVWPEEIRSVSLHDSDLTMSDADKALYKVKQNGRHGCDFY